MSLCASALMAVLAAGAADGFEPLPGDRTDYTIDFTRYFYASPAVEKAARASIDATVKRLAGRAGHLADSAQGLWETMQLYESLLVQARKDEAYLHLKASVDATQQRAEGEERALEAKVDAAIDAAQLELGQLPDDRKRQYASQLSTLAGYGYFLSEARRLHPAQGPCSAPGLGDVVAQVDGWQADLRELAPTNRDVVAFALLHLVAARNSIARCQGHLDAPDEAYRRSGWTRAVVSALLKRVAARADLNKGFQRAQAERTRQLMAPRFDFDDAQEVLRSVFRPLGTDFNFQLERLLAVENRRLDIAPGPHRRAGGFSMGFPGFTSVFYASSFSGSYDDLRRLTHEATHALQRELQSAHAVKPVYADGPHWLFEATASFSELLLADTLARRAKDLETRRFYIEQFLLGKGLSTVFDAASEADLEQAVYDGAAKGTVKSADDLDALARASKGPSAWMRIPLMYEDPFYNVNYVWAGLVALQMLGAYEQAPQRFAGGYVALLQNGFDRPADELLRAFVGIDVNNPQFVDQALAVAAERTRALEEDAP